MACQHREQMHSQLLVSQSGLCLQPPRRRPASRLAILQPLARRPRKVQQLAACRLQTQAAR